MASRMVRPKPSKLRKGCTSHTLKPALLTYRRIAMASRLADSLETLELQTLKCEPAAPSPWPPGWPGRSPRLRKGQQAYRRSLCSYRRCMPPRCSAQVLQLYSTIGLRGGMLPARTFNRARRCQGPLHGHYKSLTSTFQPPGLM